MEIDNEDEEFEDVTATSEFVNNPLKSELVDLELNELNFSRFLFFKFSTFLQSISEIFIISNS